MKNFMFLLTGPKLNLAWQRAKKKVKLFKKTNKKNVNKIV